jgi:hypothetical protein
MGKENISSVPPRPKKYFYIDGLVEELELIKQSNMPQSNKDRMSVWFEERIETVMKKFELERPPAPDVTELKNPYSKPIFDKLRELKAII